MKIAVIGLKGHHKNVLSGLKDQPGLEVVAVADDLADNLAKFRADFPALAKIDAYSDWRQLLEHATFDLACVGDENGIRDDQLVPLLQRNIHVIAEKPLATSFEKLARIREAYGRSNAELTMLLTMRHDPIFATLKELIHAGEIGEVAQVSSQKSYQIHTRPEWFKSRARLGGIIPYIGVHAVDLIRWCGNVEFTHVAASHARIGLPEIREAESSASLLFHLENGGSATCRLDYLRPMGAGSHGDDRLRFAGSKGVVEIGAVPNKILLLKGTEKPRLVTPEKAPHFLLDFLAAIAARRAPRIPAADAFRVTELVLHARAAADGKKLVEIPKMTPLIKATNR